MIKTRCPACTTEIRLASAPELGASLKCPNCDTAVEVVWLYPVTLDFQEEKSLKSTLSGSITAQAEPLGEG